MKLNEVKYLKETTAASIATTVVPLGKGRVVKRGDRKEKFFESIQIATPSHIRRKFEEIVNDITLNEGKKKSKSADAKKQILIDLLKNLSLIFENAHKEYTDINVIIDKNVSDAIMNTRDVRVYKNVIRLFDILKDTSSPKEFNLIKSGQMRAHRIQQSKKPIPLYHNTTKVDIMGMDKGIIFHAGPKKVPTMELSHGDILIVAFGSHNELGT